MVAAGYVLIEALHLANAERRLQFGQLKLDDGDRASDHLDLGLLIDRAEDIVQEQDRAPQVERASQRSALSLPP